MMENFFSSRTLNLLNKAKANFIFIPHKLNKYEPIHKVLFPVFEDRQSLQSIAELTYLHRFMNFEITMATFKAEEGALKNNLTIASKILNTAEIKFELETMSESEREFKNHLSDIAKIGKSQLISIVNLTEESFFNSKEKSFVEDIIRNKENIPVMVLHQHRTVSYGRLKLMGG